MEFVLPAGGELFTDEVRATLAGLGASDVKLVFNKRMTASDRMRNQNRLLMSCKKKRHELFAGVFTEEEKKLVHRVPPPPSETTTKGGGKEEDKGSSSRQANNKRKKNDVDNNKLKKKEKNVEAGLAVEAYDADGRSYVVALKFLTSNTGYRIKGSWSDFLLHNGLLVEEGGAAAAADIFHIEVWAFRSPMLALGEKGHPRGSLGLLFLHRRAGEADAEADEVHDDAAPDDAVEEIIEHNNGHGEGAMLQDEDEDMMGGGGAQDDDAAVVVADDGDAQVVVTADDVAGESAGGAPATRDSQLTRVENFIGRTAFQLMFLNDNDDDDDQKKRADDVNDSTAVQCQ